VDAVKTYLDSYEGKIKIAVLDHISSVPSFIWPVKELISLFKQKGSLIYVDGAHAVGQVGIDLKDLDPDFYLSNCHKWAFSCKGSAFLYVKKELQHLIHSVCISKEYKKSFQDEFSSNGTRDHANYLSIKEALEFRKHLGDQRIMDYNRKLALEAGKLICKIWKTELLVPEENMTGNIINVLLPLQDEEKLKNDIQMEIYRKHNLFFVITKFTNGKWYGRFSTQIFNQIEDYETGARTFLDHFKIQV